MYHPHQKATQLEHSSPVTCVLTGVPGHIERGKMAIKQFNALEECLLKRWYGVKKIEPVYDIDGFTGSVLIIFGECDESSYDTFKLQARFQSKDRGRVDWFTGESAMEPCLWVLDISDRNDFWQAALTTRVAIVVKERAYASAEREDDGIYEAIAEALKGMYPMSIECAYPYTCALTYGPGGPSKSKNVKQCSALIQKSLLSMGYLVESVDAKYEEHDFEGIFLIRLGYSDKAAFSAFKLQAQFRNTGSEKSQETASEQPVVGHLWVTKRRDNLVFDRRMTTVYVPLELMTRAIAAGHAEDKAPVHKLLAEFIATPLV